MLEAMSSGGRHGFDAPFAPVACHYRWYSTPEICMILERFDGIVFVGDDLLKNIYAAFNMLLRQDLALGGLKQWDLPDDEKSACRCDAQLTNPKCAKNILLDSEEVASKSGQQTSGNSPYRCNSMKPRCVIICLADRCRSTSLLPAHHWLSRLRRSPYPLHDTPQRLP